MSGWKDYYVQLERCGDCEKAAEAHRLVREAKVGNRKMPAWNHILARRLGTQMVALGQSMLSRSRAASSLPVLDEAGHALQR